MYLRAAVFYVKTQIHFEYPDKFTIHTFLQSSEKIKTLYLNQSLEIKCHPCNNFIDQSI